MSPHPEQGPAPAPGRPRVSPEAPQHLPVPAQSSAPGTAVLPGEPPGHAQGLLSWHCRAHPVLPHLHQVVVGTGVSPQASPSPDRAAPAPPGPPAQRWPRAGLSPACPGLSCWEARCTSVYPVYLILNNSSWHFKIQIVTDFSVNFIPK